MPTHTIQALRDHCLTIATRPFTARGTSVARCTQCRLAKFACLCQWQVSINTSVHFILLMHRKEVYKTTNTGRLIEDLFPEQTRAFLWDRTAPAPALIHALTDTERHTVILYPNENTISLTNQNTGFETGVSEGNDDHKKPLTVVLLDGTWKQASRMARLSPWLQGIPTISIKPAESQDGNTIRYVRQAQQPEQLSTAQAAACILDNTGDTVAATALRHYFSVFNQHCQSTRSNVPPTVGESHHFLSQLKAGT